MKSLFASLSLACCTVLVNHSPAAAGLIEQACLTSARQSASGQLCGCIQRVADQTLTSQDQRIAARFFEDPHRAQEIRQSVNTRHEAFWERYKEFGASAAAACN